MLGLSRNASNSATLGDFGTFPNANIFIDIAILKIWLHIVNNKCRHLVTEAYISEVKQNSNWTAYVRHLLCKNRLLYIWQNPSAFNSDYVVAVFTEKNNRSIPKNLAD